MQEAFDEFLAERNIQLSKPQEDVAKVLIKLMAEQQYQENMENGYFDDRGKEQCPQLSTSE